MFLHVTDHHPGNVVHRKALDDSVEDHRKAVPLFHDVHLQRGSHVLPAPCVHQPSRGVADSGADFGDPLWLKRDGDVTKAADQGNRQHIKPHVPHLHTDVFCDFWFVTTEVRPGGQRGSKRLLRRGRCGVSRHGQRSAEDGFNPCLHAMVSNRAG